MTQIDLFNDFLKFIKSNIGIKFESPRKAFSHGRIPQNFILKDINESKELIKIQFESGTPLPLEYWRFIDAISFINKNDFVPIGARTSEDYPKNSLEGYLKEIAKKKYKRDTDTKTAPHIADLLTLAGIAEFGYSKSNNNRNVQGIRLKQKF